MRSITCGLKTCVTFMMGFTLPLYLTVFPGELISLCYLFHSTITLIELHQDDVLIKLQYL